MASMSAPANLTSCIAPRLALQSPPSLKLVLLNNVHTPPPARGGAELFGAPRLQASLLEKLCNHIFVFL
jgi:hypothetical protein